MPHTQLKVWGLDFWLDAPGIAGVALAGLLGGGTWGQRVRDVSF